MGTVIVYNDTVTDTAGQLPARHGTDSRREARFLGQALCRAGLRSDTWVLTPQAETL